MTSRPDDKPRWAYDVTDEEVAATSYYGKRIVEMTLEELRYAFVKMGKHHQAHREEALRRAKAGAR